MFYDDGQVGTKIHWGQIQRLFCWIPLFAPLSVFGKNSSAHIKKTHGVNSRQVNIIYTRNNSKWNKYLSIVWVNSAKTKLKENIFSFFLSPWQVAEKSTNTSVRGESIYTIVQKKNIKRAGDYIIHSCIFHRCIIYNDGYVYIWVVLLDYTSNHQYNGGYLGPDVTILGSLGTLIGIL